MAGPDRSSHFFTTKLGTRTHYQQSGNPSGPIIILLHGLGGSTNTFAPLLPHLPTKEHNIISIDFEGFGKTALSSQDTELSVQRHVSNLDDLISFFQGSGLEKASKDPVIIIGHSLGSVIALQYAAKKPNNVAGLGLLGVGRSASHIEVVRERMLSMAEKVRKEGIESAADLASTTNFATDEKVPAGIREEVRRAVAASDSEAYAKTCEAMVSPDHVDPNYRAIFCPAVFVSGAEDTISPPQRAEDLSKLLGGKTIVSVVAGGHQPILSDLQGTKAAMKRLFELVGAGA